MFRDVTFGQYYPSKSFVHSMDARVKIILSTLYLVGIFFVNSFAMYGIVVLFLLVAILSSNVPIRNVFKSVKPIIFLIAFTMLLNIFITQEGSVIVEWWIIRITWGGVFFAFKMMLRLVFLVVGASILTLTTTPVDLTHAIESLLKPLNAIRFPVHEFALVMSITLRFIPSLMDETDRIIRAQTARGASFDTGNIIERAKAFIPILIPLLVSSFRRADELALAMDSRCYNGGAGRTKMKTMKTGYRDGVAILVMLLFIAIITLLIVFQPSLATLLPWLYV